MDWSCHGTLIHDVLRQGANMCGKELIDQAAKHVWSHLSVYLSYPGGFIQLSHHKMLN